LIDMTARRKRLAMVLAALVVVSGTTLSAWGLLDGSSASTIPKDVEPRSAPELRDALGQVVDGGVPGVIGWVQEGREARALAAGVDDLTTGASLRPAARLRVGSITKTFVATVVLQLVQEGRLRLDAPVRTWLPGLLPGGDTITVRHLLQHTSGLPDHLETPGFTEGLLENPVYEPEELVALATDRPLEFRPGTGFAYSSTGYVVAGLLVEAVTGHSLARELRDRVFGPLGLEHTSFPASKRRIGGYHARGYVPGEHAPTPQAAPLDVTDINPSWAWAAGGLVSNAADVSRFYRSLLGGRLLKPGLLREMKTTVPDPEGGGEYGLGIARVQTPCGVFWGHEGALAGYVTWALTTADAQRSAVLAVTMNPLPAASRRPYTEALGLATCGPSGDPRAAEPVEGRDPA
jgi:D-alanyl-D-alanine carboxypeptidase